MSFLDDIIIYTVTIQTDIEEGDNTFDDENGDLGENVDGDKKSDGKEYCWQRADGTKGDGKYYWKRLMTKSVSYHLLSFPSWMLCWRLEFRDDDGSCGVDNVIAESWSVKKSYIG